MKTFRKDFLWGGATAANQFEGAWDPRRDGRPLRSWTPDARGVQRMQVGSRPE